ncbi:MAG: N-formylglutamate amidohydrolase [Clostridia bacterium]
MLQEDEFKQALAYFTSASHPHSFEWLTGTGQVLVSAPHAVLQTRDGHVKQAERYTGMLCRMLSPRVGCPCLYKTRHLMDDANRDALSDYRDALCAYVHTHAIRYVLDLHQLSDTRPMALCIGTGHGQNLCGDSRACSLVQAAFEKRSLTPVTLNDPFSAGRPHTVCATVAASCGIPALQLELNTGLMMESNANFRFFDVLDALCELITSLNQGVERS